jgi:hypothetical protein
MRKIRRQLFPVILIMMLSIGAMAQQGGTISGLVSYPDNKALESATVTLLRAPDSSLIKRSLSDQKGFYGFAKLKKGAYILLVEAVGYHRWISQPIRLNTDTSTVHLDAIRLTGFTTELNHVTVTAHRPLIENKIDKTVVNVDASTTNTGLSALEILERSPGVTVDNDGNVSLKGKQGVLILIDGKPTYLNSRDLATYLKDMSANQLDQIEIMTQPSAKYDASGNSGVINIITKKNRNNGLNGSFTTSAIVAIYFKNTNNLNLNWREGKINLYANYGFSYWEGFNDIWSDLNSRQDLNSPFNRYVEEYTVGRYSARTHTFRTGIDWFPDKKTTLGLDIKGNIDHQKFTSTSVSNIFDSLHQFVQYNDAQSQNNSPVTNLGFNANFLKKLGEGREFSMDADYIFYNTQGHQYSNNYLFNSDKTSSADPYLSDGLLPALIHIYSFKSDYKLPLEDKSVLEMGVKSSYVKTDNNAEYSLFDNTDQKWETDTTLSNHFVYKENINAAYLNLQKHLKKLSVQLGLRAEQTVADGQQAIKNQSFHKNYIQLFPTAYFNYEKDSDNTFGLSYGRRIERPDYDNLNPFVHQLDRYNYDQGNPKLQPQFSHNFELSYNYKGVLNVSLNYTLITDIINDVVITLKEPGDSNYTTYHTSQNIAASRNTGLAVNYSKKLENWWTLNVFGNVFNNYYKGVIDSQDIRVNRVSFSGNFSSQFNFKKGWSAEISGFYMAKTYVSSAILANGHGMFSLGGAKQVMDGKGSVKLSLRDPLYLMNFTGNTNLSNAVTRSHYVWDNRRIIMTFTYRFGKTSNGQSQHKSSADDEQNRVKSGGQQ